jgi:hypothetical protein
MAFARDGREDELAAALDALGERMTFVVDRDGFEVVARLEGRDESPDEDG